MNKRNECKACRVTAGRTCWGHLIGTSLTPCIHFETDNQPCIVCVIDSNFADGHKTFEQLETHNKHNKLGINF